MTTYEIELTDEQARLALSRANEPAMVIANEPLASLLRSIRANPPTPIRMEEPRWGEKVIAGFRDLGRVPWTHVYMNGRYVWQTQRGTYADWDDLIDPEPHPT